MRDTIINFARTGVQALVAFLTTIPWVASLDIADSLRNVLEAVAVAVVTVVLVTVERYAASKGWDWVSRILSVGFRTTSPTYEGAPNV